MGEGGVAPAWQLWVLHVSLYMCMYMYVCMVVDVCTLVSVYIRASLYMHLYEHAHVCTYVLICMYYFLAHFFSSPSLTCLSPPRIYVLTYLFHLLFCHFLLSLLPTALCVCYSHLPIPSFSIPSLTNFVNRVISNPFIYFTLVSFPISSLLSSSTPKHIVLED